MIIGLALAARQRGFKVEIWINTRKSLFVDSVRDASKKQIIELVHRDYVQQARAERIRIHYSDIRQNTLIEALQHKAVPLVMISTWRLDGKKSTALCNGQRLRRRMPVCTRSRPRGDQPERP